MSECHVLIWHPSPISQLNLREKTTQIFVSVWVLLTSLEKRKEITRNRWNSLSSVNRTQDDVSTGSQGLCEFVFSFDLMWSNLLTNELEVRDFWWRSSWKSTLFSRVGWKMNVLVGKSWIFIQKLRFPHSEWFFWIPVKKWSLLKFQTDMNHIHWSVENVHSAG